MQQKAAIDRKAYFDYLRVFAAFFIVIIHVSSYSWYSDDVVFDQWLVLNAYKSLARFAVPIFVMISGAIFLDRDISIKKLFSKNILRLIVAFVAWSFIYALVFNIQNGISAVLIVTTTSHYHLWFIPLTIGLYICTPVLKHFVSDEKTERYFLIISFVITILIPQLINVARDFGGETLSELAERFNLNVMGDFDLKLCLGYIFYFVLGYFLSKNTFVLSNRIVIYVAGIVGLISTFILTACDYKMKNIVSDTYHDYCTLGVMLAAMAVFVLFKRIFENKSSSAIFSKFAKWTFGVYLVHPMAMELLDKLFGITANSGNAIWTVPVISIGIFVVSIAVSALLNQIPFIRKYIV